MNPAIFRPIPAADQPAPVSNDAAFRMRCALAFWLMGGTAGAYHPGCLSEIGSTGRAANSGSSDFRVGQSLACRSYLSLPCAQKAAHRRSEKPQAPSDVWSLWRTGDVACAGVSADFSLLVLGLSGHAKPPLTPKKPLVVDKDKISPNALLRSSGDCQHTMRRKALRFSDLRLWHSRQNCVSAVWSFTPFAVACSAKAYCLPTLNSEGPNFFQPGFFHVSISRQETFSLKLSAVVCSLPVIESWDSCVITPPGTQSRLVFGEQCHALLGKALPPSLCAPCHVLVLQH